MRSRGLSRRRSFVLGAAVVLGALALPAAASAATVSITGSTLTFSAGGAEENDLTIETDAGVFRVIDNNALLTAGTGCNSRAPHRVNCPTAGITLIEVLARDQDDTVNLLTGTVNATLNGGHGSDQLVSDSGDDTLIAGKADSSCCSFDSLNSGAGEDTLNGATGTFGFASSSLSAGPGNDNLIGGPGNDSMFGDTGADDLLGGDGFDSTFWSGVAPVTVTLGAGANDGEAGENDNVRADVEQIQGTPFGDTLIGTVGDQDLSGEAGPDTLQGGSGNDFLRAGPGVDTLAGEDGNDTLQDGTEADDLSGGNGTDQADYSNHSAPVTVTINNNPNDGEAGGTEGDNVRTDIENLSGGQGSDTLTGSTGDNFITGQAGDDTVMGVGGDDDLFGDFTFNSGTFGADTVNGGNGDDSVAGGGGGDDLIGGNDFDFVDYSSFAGFNNLTITANNIANDGVSGEGDNVNTSVEGIIGGNGNDNITGAGGPNTLRGGSGMDTLNGVNGNDLLQGDRCCSAFADVFNGGDGNDTASYRDHFAAVTVDIDGVADDGATTPVPEGDNVQTSVENVIGGSGGDTITGNNANNTLSGLGGNDNLFGGGGGDSLIGGGSIDTLEGQAAKDELYSRGDFATDTDNCGTEVDTVVADSFDTINPDCETVIP